MNQCMRGTVLTLLAGLILVGANQSQAADEPAEGFTRLFDGKTFEGWKVLPEKLAQKKYWRIEDGNIVIENDGGPGSDLWTNKSYKNYELTLEFKTLTKDYDTGVFVRGKSHQVQIGISGSLKKDMTACIYAPKDKKGGYPGQTDKVTAINKPNEWNTLRIVMKGKVIQTFLNGEPMVEYQGVVLEDEGPIGIQLHGKRNMKVLFRNIDVKELPAS